MFDLHQNIYILDVSSGEKERIAITTLEEMPEVISAMSDAKNIDKVILMGNRILCDDITQNIIAYSKKYYNKNNIEIEVIKNNELFIKNC